VQGTEKTGILPVMPKLRDHEKLKGLWPPNIDGPQGLYDVYHPGGEWGDLIRVKWVEPNRKGELPYISAFILWSDLEYRIVFTSDDTAFLKRLYETLRDQGVGKPLDEVGNLKLDF